MHELATSNAPDASINAG